MYFTLTPFSIYETFFMHFQTVGENTKNSGIIHLQIIQNSFWELAFFFKRFAYTSNQSKLIQNQLKIILYLKGISFTTVPSRVKSWKKSIWCSFFISTPLCKVDLSSVLLFTHRSVHIPLSSFACRYTNEWNPVQMCNIFRKKLKNVKWEPLIECFFLVICPH